MASGTSARTGIFLNGWFLNSPDMQSAVPEDVLHPIREWRVPPSEPVDYPDMLPSPVFEAYKSLWANRKVRNWCRGSPVWQSIHHDTFKTAVIDLFPFGSTASVIAALTLAEWLRDEDRTVFFHPASSTDEGGTRMDWLIQSCAKHTWQWLKESGGKGSLNLNLCPDDFKRGYIWVGALANSPPDNRDLLLYDWDKGAGAPSILQVPSVNYYHSKSDFLRHYLGGTAPDHNDPNEKELSFIYQNFKDSLDETISRPQNDKLRIVLDAWLEWGLSKEEHQNIHPNEEEEDGGSSMKHGPVEE